MLEKFYPVNGLFFYRLLFMALLILGESFFLYKLERKKNFAVKCPLAILSCFLFALIFPIPTANDFYSMMMFLVFFAYTFLVACFLFKSEKTMIFFCLICGYTTEHIAFEMYNSLSSFIIASDLKPGGLYNYDDVSLFKNGVDFTLWVVSYINVYWLSFFLFAKRIVKGKIFENVSNVKVLFLGSLFIVIDIVLNSVVSYYSSIHYERIYIGIVSIINMLLCIITMTYLFEIYYSGNLKRENAIIKEIRKEEKRQYQISKETRDMVNIKCHDLRHQIRTLGQKQKVNEEVITDISKLIKVYDSSITTTNEALNVILSEKSLLCTKFNIDFICLVDGDALSFMSDEDIYSLFGNILDNAIEAVKKLDEKDRSIKLSVKRKGNIVSVSSNNKFSHDLEIVNGLPKTTKDDRQIHGYGLKSIKLIAEKYNGTMDLKLTDNVFSLNLMFIE